MRKNFRSLAIVLLACATLGCTSFRTTSLYRFANDSVAPQRTNKKLKGLPVKLKVPSHVSVVVYEQQIILGTAPAELESLNKAVKDAAAKVQVKSSALKALDDSVDEQLVSIDTATGTINHLEVLMNSSPMQEDKDAYENIIKKQRAIKADADGKLKIAQEKRTKDQPVLEAELALENSKLELARLAATPGYAFVSFNPPQYQVETQLEYTDKIFLVDFKRPAAGILDLTNAKMDDQQYFSQVQAQIQEKTIEDISGALNTIKEPLISLRAKKTNSARPTSASTPEAEGTNDVQFQKSVVAIQRFDISEPGWEDNMTSFVNEKLGGSSAAAVEGYGLNNHVSQGR